VRVAFAIAAFFVCLGAWAASETELTALMRQAMQGNAAARATLEDDARAGSATAAHLLGHLYLRGQGVPRSEATAIEWFDRAAQQGHQAGGLLAARDLQVETRDHRHLAEVLGYVLECDLSHEVPYFTAPKVRPRTSCFCENQPSIRIGAIAMVEAAESLA